MQPHLLINSITLFIGLMDFWYGFEMCYVQFLEEFVLILRWFKTLRYFEKIKNLQEFLHSSTTKLPTEIHKH